MLAEISVKNIALLEDVQVNFQEGFNVITGETGAGKSILIESLKIALGEKVAQKLVPQAAEGLVEIVYDLQGDEETAFSLESAGFSHTDTLIMRRKVSPHGRSRIYVNDSPATGQFAAEITSELVSILGQHGYQRLFGSRNATKLLDAFSGALPLYNEYLSVYRNWRKVIREIEALKEDAPNISGRMEWIKGSIAELTALDMKPGEEREIEEELPLLKNAAKIREAISVTVDMIDQGEESSLSILKRSVDSLKGASRYDSALAGIATKLEEHMFGITDIARDLMKRFSVIDIDEEKYQFLAERLSNIKRLSRKYEVHPEGLLRKVEDLKEEQGKIQSSIDSLNYLAREEEKLRENVLRLGRSLSKRRRESTADFEGSVLAELSDLGLSGASFRVVISDSSEDELSSYGLERADFFFSPSSSYEGGPLFHIASGGELSRIMLAVHNTVSAGEKFKTLVFDEVDAGIGGSMAEVIGEKLKQLSSSAQVICITHLPQIAALGDHHIKIVKVRSGKRERAVAKSLDRSERVAEIARMVSGERVSDEARKYAENLLKSGSRR